jgi:hypothetical protein
MSPPLTTVAVVETITFDTDPMLISTEVVGEVYTRFPKGQWPAAGLTVMIPSSTNDLHVKAIKGIFKDDPITIVLYDETQVPHRGRNVVYVFETGTEAKLVPWVGA